MDIHCVDNWLFHNWGPHALTSDDDPSLSASLSSARPVDPADQHDSRHPQHSEADDSSFAVFAGSLACSEAL